MNLNNYFNVDMGWAPQRVDSNVFESQVTMADGVVAMTGNVIYQKADGKWDVAVSPDLTAAPPIDYWMVVRAGDKDNLATDLIIAVKTQMIVTIDYDVDHFTLAAGYVPGVNLTVTAQGKLAKAANKDQIIGRVFADLRPAKLALQVLWTGGTARMF